MQSRFTTIALISALLVSIVYWIGFSAYVNDTGVREFIAKPSEQLKNYEQYKTLEQKSSGGDCDRACQAEFQKLDAIYGDEEFRAAYAAYSGNTDGIGFLLTPIPFNEGKMLAAEKLAALLKGSAENEDAPAVGAETKQASGEILKTTLIMWLCALLSWLVITIFFVPTTGRSSISMDSESWATAMLISTPITLVLLVAAIGGLFMFT